MSIACTRRKQREGEPTARTMDMRYIIPDSLHPSVKDLINACWAEDPAQRPSFEEVLTRLNGLEGRNAGLSVDKSPGNEASFGTLTPDLEQVCHALVSCKPRQAQNALFLTSGSATGIGGARSAGCCGRGSAETKEATGGAFAELYQPQSNQKCVGLECCCR